MKGVFDVKPSSGWNDELGVRYHFPSNYLAATRELIGDWIVYREPQRNGGRRAYIGVARVVRVEPDPAQPGHYYAELADYLAFDRLVPLVVQGRYAEAPMRNVGDPTRVGAYLQGRSVRPLADEDFAAIVVAGLSETLAPENALRLGLEFPPADLPPLPFPGVEEDFTRRVELMLVNRKIREASFRLHVCEAYENRCAVTGLRMINGGGRAEVQAAHIKPVGAGGPDIVQNGIALSGTVHWLFDRHLISIDEDYRLLVSHNRVPAELTNLFRPQHETIHLPKDRRFWPHPAFLAHHREQYAGAS